jgi:amino acid permease
MSVSPSDHFITYGTIKPSKVRKGLHDDDEVLADILPTTSTATPSSTLHRGLSFRQVQMIAIAGTIGTGLFLGTGRSLAQGGPATMLICYSVVGFIVYITLLLLGEMATQYPVAGESLNAQSLLRLSESGAWCQIYHFFAKSSYSMSVDDLSFLKSHLADGRTTSQPYPAGFEICHLPPHF